MSKNAKITLSLLVATFLFPFVSLNTGVESMGYFVTIAITWVALACVTSWKVSYYLAKPVTVRSKSLEE
jgi:hypothetical protein